MKTVLFCLGVVVIFLARETFTQYELDPFMLDMLKKINSTEEYCKLVGEEDCAKLDEYNATEMIDEKGEKMVVTGYEEPEVALFDACNPREQTVALPRHPDPDITVWPPCTRAMRCGGCCTSDVFSCEPTVTTEKFLKVFDTRLPYPGAHRFKFLGVRIVKIIEHIHCDAQCKTKEHECHKYQKYDKRRCRCYCRHERENLKSTCSKEQIWDENECDCICPNRNTLVCPDPSYFSSATCKCTLKMGVTGEIDLDKLFEQLDKGLVGSDIILNNQGSSGETGMNVLAGNMSAEEAGKEEGGDAADEKETGEEGKIENTTSTMASTTTTTNPPTTTTTATTTTTTTAKTTTQTPEPTKPKPTEEPCKGTICFGNWKAKKLSNGNCQCMPVF